MRVKLATMVLLTGHGRGDEAPVALEGPRAVSDGHVFMISVFNYVPHGISHVS